ncbi:MAG: heparinase II/III family protein [Candidatus Nanopelagicales bacterium]
MTDTTGAPAPTCRAHRPRRRPLALLATVTAAAVAAGLLPLLAGSAYADEPFPVPRKPLVRLVPGEAADQCFGAPVTPIDDSDLEQRGKTDAERAAQIMAGQLQLGDFEPWPLPQDPTWAEDPYGDANWVSRYHRLTWVDVLRREGQRTGNQAMLDRYNALLRDWAVDNPRDNPASPWAWFRINAAERAIVYLCKLGRVGTEDYLPDLLVQHAVYLADPAEYPGIGNHALWMDQGLIAIGCATSVPEYADLGEQRLTELVKRSIDPEGVSDEGSVTYQKLNWEWYSDAEARVRLCGRTAPPEFARIELMDDFLAHALMPDGTPMMIGDTVLDLMNGLKGTPAEYVRYQGASGTPPDTLWKTYSRGYTFGRSGWGDATRPAADQAAFWLKFGQAPQDQVHGHQDLGSFELYNYGSRLIWDGGLYAYLGGEARSYMVSRASHNVVDVPNATYRPENEAPLLAESHGDGWDMVSVQVNSVSGVNWNRRFLFSRAGGWVLVDDRITQSSSRAVVQRWNLGADKTVATGLFGGRAVTSGPGANLAILWLGDRPTRRVYNGVKDPRWVGWRSTTYRELTPAPAVEAVLWGKKARFVTLLAPLRAGAPDDVVVKDLSLTDDAISLVVSSGGVTEQLKLDATTGYAGPPPPPVDEFGDPVAPAP